MTKHAITVRVEYDTLTELHKLTANSKTNDFADVAGDLLDRAAAPNTYLVSLAPSVIEFFKREAWNTHLPIEYIMAIALATGAKVAMNTNDDK
jgi:hypothetical protein